MVKPLVQITPFVVSGSMRVEVGLFMSWASAWQSANPDKILDLFIVPEKYTPAPVARNRAVKKARERGVDLLVMLDDDMAPPPQFFEAAVNFLREQPGPAVIGSVYCTAPPIEDVLAFEWVAAESRTKDVRWKLERIRREDAARRSGIEQVANLGTGCTAYDLRCFDRIAHPYFDYDYSDETHTEVVETEDCFAHRKLAMAGVPLYVHWDFWSGHWKQKCVNRPVPVQQHDIDNFYIRQAEENLQAAARTKTKGKAKGRRAEAPPLRQQVLPAGCKVEANGHA